MKIRFAYGEETRLPQEKVAGRLLFTTDTGRIFLDINESERIDLYKVDLDAIKVLIGDNTVASQIATAINTLKNETIGSLGDGETIVNMIKDIEDSLNDADIQGLEERIQANEEAIKILNGSDEGSVTKKVADAITALVNDADQNFDTLREISDWILNDTTGAAKMANDIKTLNSAESTEGSVAYTVKSYIDDLDSNIIAPEGKYISTITQTDGKLTATYGDLPDITSLSWEAFGE